MVSIILPISRNENQQNIKQCLEAIAGQTHQDFELILVTPVTLTAVVDETGLGSKKDTARTRILQTTLNKTQSRNKGAKIARGDYLLHWDIDQIIPPGLLKELSQRAEQGQEAVVINHIRTGHTFWAKCRELESKVILTNPHGIPSFIKKSLFERIGGYEEQLDPLDDWSLKLRLTIAGIKCDQANTVVISQVSPTVRSSFWRMYRRGQAYPLLSQLYSQNKKTPQPNPRCRKAQRKKSSIMLETKIDYRMKLFRYIKAWPLLCQSLPVTAGLAILKIVDWLGWWWGTQHPKNQYELISKAKNYERKRLNSNFTRYKHYAEVRSLFNLLGQKSLKEPVLEVGCGTGRITQELVKKGYQVIPTDPAEEMLRRYREKNSAQRISELPKHRDRAAWPNEPKTLQTKLPTPVKCSGTKLPFPNAQFNTAIAIRVLWHLRPHEQERVLAEMDRVSSQNIIFDMVNPNRLLSKLLIGRDTYPRADGELNLFLKKRGLRIADKVPLDSAPPLWLNLLPKPIAQRLFPHIYHLDLILAKHVTPGRWLFKVAKSPCLA